MEVGAIDSAGRPAEANLLTTQNMGSLFDFDIIHVKVSREQSSAVVNDDGASGDNHFVGKNNDSITHGSALRTNDGHRRMVLYRYSPRWIRTRFHYVPSDRLLSQLTDDQRTIMQPIAPRRPPENL